MTRGNRLVIVTLAVVALGAISWFVWAATLNVPGDFSTIQKAVDAAKSGDTILLAPGVYSGPINLNGKEGISIQASDPDPTKTIVKGGGGSSSVFNITNSTNIALKGFSITGGFDGVFAQGSNGLTLDEMNISGNGNSGVSFGGTCDNVLIQNSMIDKNGFDGINLKCTGKNVTIQNNDISLNGQTDSRGVGIRLSAGITNVIIQNNTLFGNAFAGIHPQ